MFSLKHIINSKKKRHGMIMFSLYATLLYFFISSADMYKFTGFASSKFEKIPQITNDACPTTYGILLHAIFYIVLMIIYETCNQKNKVTN